MAATVIAAIAGPGLTNVGQSLPNKYGITIRNGPNGTTDNTVNVLVAFDDTAANGSYPLKPGETITLRPTDAANTNNIWLQAADGATSQTVQVFVSGAR